MRAARPWCATSPRPSGAKPAQIALAWLLGKGDDIVPIPGTKRRTYLEENSAPPGCASMPATWPRSTLRWRPATSPANAIRRR